MKHDFPICGLGKLCGLFGKTRAAIYDYQRRLHNCELQDEIVLQCVQQIRLKLPRLGTRKLHYKLVPMLKEHNIQIGRDYLFELLDANKLLIRQRKRKIVTTNSRHWMRKYRNQVKGIVIDRPEQVWVSDITFIRLNNQWAYLSLITDAYSRKIMGFCFRMDMSAQGCLAALQMALNNRQYPKQSLIHHSDRGSQYCSSHYIGLLAKNNIAVSMTENGDPYENALAERMNGIIKNEFNLYQSTSCFDDCYEKVRISIKAYNEDRPHGSCNMLTPQQAHQNKGKLIKKWKTYPIKSNHERSKKEAEPAPLKEQGDATFLLVEPLPITFEALSGSERGAV